MRLFLRGQPCPKMSPDRALGHVRPAVEIGTVIRNPVNEMMTQASEFFGIQRRAPFSLGQFDGTGPRCGGTAPRGYPGARASAAETEQEGLDLPPEPRSGSG